MWIELLVTDCKGERKVCSKCHVELSAEEKPLMERKGRK